MEHSKKQNNKRSKIQSDSDEEPCGVETFPRFMVIQSTDPTKPVAALSPFVIEKSISSSIGTPKSVKKLKSGCLLVECERRGQADNIMRMKTFFDIPVTSFAHTTLNSSKGVMRCRDLAGVSDPDVIEGMKHEGVTAVRRIRIKRNNALQDTNTFVLTFNKPTVPKVVKVGFLQVKVEVYIPNPLRCYKCQKYGHHEDRCSRDKVCGRCGDRSHQEADCRATPHCVNCGKEHHANSKDCDTWKQEKEIQRVKFTNNIPYPEARKLVQAKISLPGPSFSTVVKHNPKITKDAETQTDQPDSAKNATTTANIPHFQPPQKSTASTQTTFNNNSPAKAQSNKQKRQTNKQQKGSDDPIKLYNMFGELESMDAEETASCSQGSSKPSKGKFTPVLPPDK